MKLCSWFRVVYLALVPVVFNNCKGQNLKEDDFLRLRREMVERQLRNRGIHDAKVLDAFMKVPRHIFVPPEYRDESYDDTPLPIGYNQTISQPYIVAFMTEILKLGKNMKVLEIGTGSGYQAAILASLCKEVYSVEIIDSLAVRARKTLDMQGFKNIRIKTGDGYLGWKAFAPFDAIVVTCAPTDIPKALADQLAEGGRMIIPVGAGYKQKLYLIEKIHGEIRQQAIFPVLFVPMRHGDSRNQ